MANLGCMPFPLWWCARHCIHGSPCNIIWLWLLYNIQSNFFSHLFQFQQSSDGYNVKGQYRSSGAWKELQYTCCFMILIHHNSEASLCQEPESKWVKKQRLLQFFIYLFFDHVNNAGLWHHSRCSAVETKGGTRNPAANYSAVADKHHTVAYYTNGLCIIYRKTWRWKLVVTLL